MARAEGGRRIGQGRVPADPAKPKAEWLVGYPLPIRSPHRIEVGIRRFSEASLQTP